MRFSSPGRDQLLGSRWLRPLAHRLRDPRLWHLNRESFARGLALGLFIGFLVPIGQTPLAALAAIPMRAHLLSAASATLVTNPLTFPLIYYVALRWGETLLAKLNLGAPQVEGLMGSALNYAAPIAAGLLFFGVASGVAAYVGVKLFWRLRMIQRWRNRPGRRMFNAVRQGRHEPHLGRRLVPCSKAPASEVVEQHE